MNTANIGKLIHDRRKELGISSVVLANRIGVSQSTISRWESGQIKDIKRAQIYLLSKYLYIPIDTLLGLSEKTETEDLRLVKAKLDIIDLIEDVNNVDQLKDIAKIIQAIK